MQQPPVNGRIRLSGGAASPTNELPEITHVTPFRTYRVHSTVITNRKNGLTGEQLATGTDSRPVATKGCHVGYSRELVGTVYCIYGQSNMTIIWRPPVMIWRLQLISSGCHIYFLVTTSYYLVVATNYIAAIAATSYHLASYYPAAVIHYLAAATYYLAVTNYYLAAVLVLMRPTLNISRLPHVQIRMFMFWARKIWRKC